MSSDWLAQSNVGDPENGTHFTIKSSAMLCRAFLKHHKWIMNGYKWHFIYIIMDMERISFLWLVPLCCGTHPKPLHLASTQHPLPALFRSSGLLRRWAPPGENASLFFLRTRKGLWCSCLLQLFGVSPHPPLSLFFLRRVLHLFCTGPRILRCPPNPTRPKGLKAATAPRGPRPFGACPGQTPRSSSAAPGSSPLGDPSARPPVLRGEPSVSHLEGWKTGPPRAWPSKPWTSWKHC